MAVPEEEYAPEGGSGLPPFLTDPLGVLRRRWRWMAATLALAALPAVAVVLLFPMTYESTAKMLIAGHTIPDELVPSTIEEGVDSQVNAMVAEVMARSSLNSIIEDLDLGGRMDAGLTREAQIRQVRRAIAIEAERQVNTGGRRQTDVIYVIKTEWGDPQIAAAMANAVATRLTDANLRRRGLQASRTTEFLRRAMERAELQLREQVGEIGDYKGSYRGELPSELGTNMGRLDRLQQQRQALILQINEGEGRLLLMRTRGVDRSPGELRLDELERQLADQEASRTEEHPSVISLRRRLEEQRALVATEAEAARRSGDAAPATVVVVEERRITALRARLARVETDMTDLDARVSRTHERAEELSSMEQGERVLREQYADALRKHNNAMLAENLERAQQGIQITRVESGTPARTPRLPRWKLGAGAIGAVIALALGVGLLLEFVDPVLLNRAQIEQLTGGPLLGMIPKVT